MLGRRREVSALDALTPSELEVLGQMAEGRTNKAISGDPFLSEPAVERHVTGIFQKLRLTATDQDHRRVLAVLRYLEER
jgi:DNA-binding NarL/FixJ family response regulator